MLMTSSRWAGSTRYLLMLMNIRSPPRVPADGQEHGKSAPSSKRAASDVEVGKVDCDEVRGLLGRRGEGLGLLLVLLVGAREPLRVLPQVLLPRGHYVELDELVWRLAIPEQAPVGRSGAQLSLIHISEPTRLGMISYAV